MAGGEPVSGNGTEERPSSRPPGRGMTGPSGAPDHAGDSPSAPSAMGGRGTFGSGPTGGAHTAAATDPGESADPSLPRRFGPYVLLRLLATGGMAELFLAQQRSVAGFEKLLVVKRILPHLARDSVFIEMLLSEARIAATLNHPNIAHVFDVGVYEGEYYIAMEFIRGEDLRGIVRQMRKKGVEEFPLEHAVAVGLGCCAGLAYAHETTDLDGHPLELVHRDVSPQNVVVSFSGDVKLVDFGIAKAGRSQMEDTHAGRLKGKIPYMSPEQASGGELDSRSDLFSLGIVLYELSTGRRLFKGTSELESLKMITEGEIPRPRELHPRVPEALDAILMKLLARDPDQRYRRARDVQADLEAFVRESRLAVSPLSFGAFVSGLFEDEIPAQEAMLQEARQVARTTTAPPPPITRTSEAGTLPPGSGEAAAPPEEPGTGAPVGGVGGTSAAATSDPARASEASPPVPGVPTRVPLGRAVLLLFLVAAAAAGLAWWLRPAAEDAPPTADRPRSGSLPRKGPRTAPTEAPEDATEAAPSEPPAAGAIRVRTTPPGARIHLDGTDTGVETPATLGDLTADRDHELRLEREGHAPVTIEARPEPGGTRDLELTLAPAPPLGPDETLLRLELDPADAEVRFAGRPVDGEGALRSLRTSRRRGRLLVRKDGFVPQERRLELPPGEATDVSVRLREERAPTREQAEAVRGGRRRARGPQESEPSEVATGRLVFDARPWCEVTLNGRRLGQTPVVAEAVPVGRHRLVCRNPEAGLRKEATVEVRAGETTRMRLDLR